MENFDDSMPCTQVEKTCHTEIYFKKNENWRKKKQHVVRRKFWIFRTKLNLLCCKLNIFLHTFANCKQIYGQKFYPIQLIFYIYSIQKHYHAKFDVQISPMTKLFLFDLFTWKLSMASNSQITALLAQFQSDLLQLNHKSIINFT